MNWPPSETHITTWWCFHRNELVISFPDAQLAAKYQRANPEGRIYSNLSKDDQASKEVYLPRPEGLLSLRSSSQSQSYSLVLDFATEDNARVWHEKALITSIIPDRSKKRVYISREVRSQKLMPPRQEAGIDIRWNAGDRPGKPYNTEPKQPRRQGLFGEGYYPHPKRTD